MISYSCGGSAGRTSGATGRVTSSSTSGSTGRTGGSSSLNGALGSLISGARSVASTAINTVNGGRTGSTPSSTSYGSTGGTNRNTGSSTGGTSSGGISYSCGSSSYGGSSSSVSGSGSNKQTFNNLTQIGSNRTTTRVTSNLTTSAAAQIHNGNLYVGNQQVYIKEENGKNYIVDSKGNYVYNDNGNRRAISTDKLKSSTVSNITYKQPQQNTNTGSTTAELLNQNASNIFTNPSIGANNKLDGKLRISGDKLYVGDQRVYVKRSFYDDKYYMVDSNGNYVYNDDGNKRAINVSNIKDMSNVIYRDVLRYNSVIPGSVDIYKKDATLTDSKLVPVNGEYYIDGKKVTISNNDKNKDGNYYLIDENGNYIRNSAGKLRVLNPSNMKEELDNYAKYGYTYGNAQPIFDQMSAAGHSESEINDLKKNISKIEGTQITLANGTKFDSKGMSSSQLYNAVLTGGLVTNDNYVAGSSGISTMATGNKPIDQLRNELGLHDGVNGNKKIDNKFGYYDKGLTAHQTYVLNTFDVYCDKKGLSDQQKKDWAYIIGRESGFNTGADNGSCYGLGQLKSYNIDTYAADPGKYRSGDAAAQIDATYNYIMGRYGSIENARAYWDNHGWY